MRNKPFTWSIRCFSLVVCDQSSTFKAFLWSWHGIPPEGRKGGFPLRMLPQCCCIPSASRYACWGARRHETSLPCWRETWWLPNPRFQPSLYKHTNIPAPVPVPLHLARKINLLRWTWITIWPTPYTILCSSVYVFIQRIAISWASMQTKSLTHTKVVNNM